MRFQEVKKKKVSIITCIINLTKKKGRSKRI